MMSAFISLSVYKESTYGNSTRCFTSATATSSPPWPLKIATFQCDRECKWPFES